MHGVTPYLLLAMLGAAIAGAGFATAGAGGTAPGNPDLGFYLSAKARSGEIADPALAVAAGIPDHSGRERALVYAAVRDVARSAGIPAAAESAIATFESVRSVRPGSGTALSRLTAPQSTASAPPPGSRIYVFRFCKILIRPFRQIYPPHRRSFSYGCPPASPRDRSARRGPARRHGDGRPDRLR